jgi:hypothetical protein
MGTVNIVRQSGDYQLQAKNGGIVFDVTSGNTTYSANTGTVTIYGNLDIIGNSTYVESTATNIKDNIIFLNAGETNNYVTMGTSGIAISRGSISTLSNAASVLYNDSAYWSFDNITNNRGVWQLSSSDQTSAIKVNAIRVSAAQNTLNLFGKENPNAVLNVRGTTDYENNVVDDDDIPNKKYVDSKAYAGEEFTKKIKVGKSFIEINDNSLNPLDPYYRSNNRIFGTLGTSTNVVFQFQDTSALLQGLTISDTNILVNAGRYSNTIAITPQSTGTVQINSALSLSNVSAPTPVNYVTHIYSTSTVGGGGTGLYFVNTTKSDELVSRRRSIIYGIIF